MERFYFEAPTLNRKQDAIDFLKEFKDYGSNAYGTGGFNRYYPDNYEGWLEKLEVDRNREVDEEHVPAETFFLVRESDRKLIGIINIRLALNEKLKQYGGNIGYSIRPTERGNGYNNINLYLGLKFCNKHNIEEVLLDADLDNPASWKTMEAMGGVRIREYFDAEHDHTMTVDYLINVKNALAKCAKYEKFIVNKN